MGNDYYIRKANAKKEMGRLTWFKVVKTRENAEISGLYGQIDSISSKLASIDIEDYPEKANTFYGEDTRIEWIRKMSKILFDFEEKLMEALEDDLV